MKNNIVTVIGTISSDITWSHKISNRDFYTCTITVKRFSGAEDHIPLIIPDPVMEEFICKAARVKVCGEYRSYNQGNHLQLYIFALEIDRDEAGEDINEIFLEGYVCSRNPRRLTPFGKTICDSIIAVNRGFRLTSYIPLIFWGKNAMKAESMEVGDKIKCKGRIQSREYIKYTDDGKSETRTAYEVSVSSYERIAGGYDEENSKH